jgi:hypothetical protein
VLGSGPVGRPGGGPAASPAYGAEQGRRGERKGPRDWFAISKMLGTVSKNKLFSLLLDSNEKILNTIFFSFSRSTTFVSGTFSFELSSVS